MSDERAQRAAARARWPLVKVRLDQEAAPSVSDASPEQRVAMVWALTLDAWAIRGEPIPDYPRALAPGRILRPAKP
jgi:hypothetical protein